MRTSTCDCDVGYAGSGCEMCARGYQDNDADGECVPGCGLVDGCTGRRRCDDSGGTAKCVCAQGHEGVDCGNCSPGYEDHEGDGTCKRTCSAADIDCGGRGQCDDSTGLASCICNAGHAGQRCNECAAGYQDNDRDGVCSISCEAAGYSCSGYGVCDDSTGEPFCACDSGFTDDGAGNCLGTSSYIVSSVNDGLDATDKQIMDEGLQMLGYVEVADNSNVSNDELIGYLQRPVTILYHTGHGFSGLVKTANGYVRPGSAKIQVMHTVFATCLTVGHDGWRDAMSARAKTVLGYSEDSYDPTDNVVARAYLEEIGNGRRHMQAWYLANAGIRTLSDRWVGYERQDQGIVEYSARSGNVPMGLVSTKAWVELGAEPGVRVAKGLVDDVNSYADLFRARAVAVSDVVRRHIERRGLDAHAETSLTDAEATQVAQQWLLEGEGLPDDAVLDDVQAISAQAGSGHPGRVVAYVVRYRRELMGLAVRGNGVEDHIAVMVQSHGEVTSVSRYWPPIAVVSSADAEDTPWAGDVLSVGDAIAAAVPRIAEVLKGVDVSLLTAKPVYGTAGPGDEGSDLRPAYEVRGMNGIVLIIDAVTGDLVSQR